MVFHITMLWHKQGSTSQGSTSVLLVYTSRLCRNLRQTSAPRIQHRLKTCKPRITTHCHLKHSHVHVQSHAYSIYAHLVHTHFAKYTLCVDFHQLLPSLLIIDCCPGFDLVSGFLDLLLSDLVNAVCWSPDLCLYLYLVLNLAAGNCGLWHMAASLENTISRLTSSPCRWHSSHQVYEWWLFSLPRHSEHSPRDPGTHEDCSIHQSAYWQNAGLAHGSVQCGHKDVWMGPFKILFLHVFHECLTILQRVRWLGSSFSP